MTSIQPLGAQHGIDLMTPAAPSTRAVARAQKRAGKLAQRGMSTAEYAVGILAAVAFALALLRIFNDNKFFEGMFKLVLKIITTISGKIV